MNARFELQRSKWDNGKLATSATIFFGKEIVKYIPAFTNQSESDVIARAVELCVQFDELPKYKKEQVIKHPIYWSK